MKTFGDIITLEEQSEILEATRQLVLKLFVGRVVIEQLQTLLDKRFEGSTDLTGH